jgi:DNA-binding SARP family transcriptional activator
MARLSIYLLGTFQVRLNDQFVTNQLRSEKERLLLAYLAMERQHSHPRSNLAELFWPDRQEPIARTNLRQALMGVRNTIGDRIATSPFLQLVEETIQFDPPYPYWVDTSAFLSCFQAVQSHDHPQLASCETCMQRFHEAVSLYRGDFLSGFLPTSTPLLMDWINRYRDQFFRYYLSALHNLTVYYRGQGNIENALRYARLQVKVAPIEERGQRQLMRLLASEGMRSAAMQQYLSLKNMLWEELGREPSKETEILFDKIRHGRSVETGRLDPNAKPAPHISAFTGRQDELERFAKDLADERCRLLVLIGSEGAGKTRLALHLANQHVETFRDGVWFVDTHEESTEEQLIASIAQSLGLQISDRYSLRYPIRNQLIEFLRPFETLLILDGFDQLLDEMDFISELLKEAPGVRVMVTCRKRFIPPDACPLELKGLAFPKNFADPNPLDYPAVRLFLNKAQAIRPNFDLSEENLYYGIQICQLTGGNPLAIELAAARLSDLSCKQVALGLQHDLAVLQASLNDPTRKSKA